MGALDKLKFMIGGASHKALESNDIELAQTPPSQTLQDIKYHLEQADIDIEYSLEPAQSITNDTGGPVAVLPKLNDDISTEETLEFETHLQENEHSNDFADKAPSKDTSFAADFIKTEAAPQEHNERTRSLGPARKTDNLSYIRADLAQLNEDMSSGEQFYSQSLKRINNLINYAYETEANLSALEHLEPENQRLKQDLGKARELANSETVRAESFKSKADAYENRYLDARQSLEQAQLTLNRVEGERETLERKIADTEVEVSGLKNSNRTIRNELAVDRQTQESLTSKNLSLTSDLSLALSEKLELEKRALELTSRAESLGSKKLDFERALTQARTAQRNTIEENIALKTELEKVLADVKVFKQQFDDTAQARGSELNSLRAQLSDLQAEIQIKTDIITHTHEQMAELRTQYDIAQRGRKNLLLHIEQEKAKTERLSDAETNAKDQAKASNAQIISLQSEVDHLRHTNFMQSEKLKKYISIHSMPIGLEPERPEKSSTPQPIKEPLESRARRKAEREAKELEALDKQGPLSNFHKINLLG